MAVKVIKSTALSATFLDDVNTAKTDAEAAETAAAASASAASTSETNAAASETNAAQSASDAAAAAAAAQAAKAGVGGLRDELGTAWIPIDTGGGQPVTIDASGGTGSSSWSGDDLITGTGSGEGGYVTLSLTGTHTANNLSPVSLMAARVIIYGTPGVAESTATVVFLDSGGGTVSTTTLTKFLEGDRYNSSATGQGVYGYLAENISIPGAAVQVKINLATNTSESVSAAFWVAASPYGLETDPATYATQTYAQPRYALITAKSTSFTADTTLTGYHVPCTAALTATLPNALTTGTHFWLVHNAAIGNVTISAGAGATVYNNAGTFSSRGSRRHCFYDGTAWHVSAC